MSAIRPISDLQIGVANTEIGVIQAPERRTNKRDKREHAKEAHPLRCSPSWIVLSAMERTLGLELEIRRPQFRDGRPGQPYAVSRLAGLIAK